MGILNLAHRPDNDPCRDTPQQTHSRSTRLFRLWFETADAAHSSPVELPGVIEWEDSVTAGRPPRQRHYYLVRASDDKRAIGLLAGSLGATATSAAITAVALTPPHGWRGLGSQAIAPTPQWGFLSELQADVLRALVDGAEPRWLLAHDCRLSATNWTLIAACEELEELGLIQHTQRRSADPRPGVPAMEDWWGLTDRAWDALGLVRRPWYRN